MNMRHIAMAGALALGLAGVASASQASRSTGTTTAPAARSTSTVPATSASQESALAALQDARTTVSRLAEESMSHNARDAYDRLSTSFRSLYKAYTGHDPDERQTAFAAGSHAKPSDWKPNYDEVTARLAAMIGPAAETGHSGTAAVAGTTGSGQQNPTGTLGQHPKVMGELTQSERDDLLALRGQLERFEQAATSQTPKR